MFQGLKGDEKIIAEVMAGERKQIGINKKEFENEDNFWYCVELINSQNRQTIDQNTVVAEISAAEYFQDPKMTLGIG